MLYEQFDKQNKELDNLKWATLRLSEDTRFLKEENIKSLLKLIDQDKIYLFPYHIIWRMTWE